MFGIGGARAPRPCPARPTLPAGATDRVRRKPGSSPAAPEPAGSADARLADCRHRRGRRPSARSRSSRRRRHTAPSSPPTPRCCQQHLRRATRQSGRGIERDAAELVLRRVGEIAHRAVGREADRVWNGDARKTAARSLPDGARRSRQRPPPPCVPWCRSRTSRKDAPVRRWTG